MTTSFSNPTDIAERGQKIYEEKYRENYARNNAGQFVAIDVISAKAFLAPHPEEAIRKAQKDSPNGIFHLIKIGFAGAYRVSYTNNVRSQWLFRQRQSGG